MNPDSVFRWRSLKTRVTLFTLLIFVIGLWSLALYSSRMLRADMQRLMGEQQFSTVSILAAEVNHELDDRLRMLEMFAGNIGPTIAGSPAAVQVLLEQRPVLQNLFNGGIVAYRLDGTAIASAPLATGRIGINYADRDYLAGPLKEGKPTIGKPHLSKSAGFPEFIMAVPIRDAEGRVAGAVAGVVNLGQPNFLDRFTESPYGKAGGYMLVARQHRLFVTATDKRLVLKTIPAPGSNDLRDRFIQGHEGSGVAVNPFGVEMLVAVKSVPVAEWLFAAAKPTAEIFAPIRAMQHRMLLAAIFLTLLAGGLTWWMLRRELDPMIATAGKLAAMADAKLPLLPLPVVGQEEIVHLIGGFNRLLETLAQREATLRESEARYRSFFENSQDAIFVHRGNNIIFANDRTAKLFRTNSAALLGRDWHELVEPEDWAVAEGRVGALTRGEASSMPPLERRHLTPDGQMLVMEASAARIIFDGQPAVLSVYRDITERKRAEEQHLTDARQQRDTLVREVHHRIKNNLQSVAGLLQRELGQFVELDPRLETAISQVRAIAVVHGLQSNSPDEAVRLCDSVENICKSVAELSQRPVQFDIEDEQTSFRPVRVANDEAVPVALVLNELILNAVKHSPRGSAAPTVSLSADGASAQMVIRNALETTPEFDIDSGAGLGTGLSLVRSLLPARGAHLTYELDTENFMLTRLNLTAPVVSKTLEKDPG